MSQFAAGIVEARIHFVINDDSAAHSGTKRNHNAVAGSLRRTGNRLAPCGGVGVVFNLHPLHAQALPEHIRQGKFAERQVVGILHYAGIVVCDSRGGNPHAGNLRQRHARLGAQRTTDSGNIIHDLLRRSFGSGRHALFLYKLFFFIHKTHGNVGAAKVHTDSVHKNSPLLIHVRKFLYSYVSL